MLYVGYLEKPFIWLKYGMLAGIGAIFFAAKIAAATISLRWARTIFRPMEQMEATMRRVEDGDSTARVGSTQAG
jgi:HAMP domain-containing protein